MASEAHPGWKTELKEPMMEARRETQETKESPGDWALSVTVEGGSLIRNPGLPDVLGKVPGLFLNSQIPRAALSRWLPVFTYSSVFGGSLIVLGVLGSPAS